LSIRPRARRSAEGVTATGGRARSGSSGAGVGGVAGGNTSVDALLASIACQFITGRSGGQSSGEIAGSSGEGSGAGVPCKTGGGGYRADSIDVGYAIAAGHLRPAINGIGDTFVVDSVAGISGASVNLQTIRILETDTGGYVPIANSCRGTGVFDTRGIGEGFATSGHS
jgi:hypothetical protein